MYFLYLTATIYIFYGIHLKCKMPTISNEEKILLQIENISIKLIHNLFLNCKQDLRFSQLISDNCKILNNKLEEDNNNMEIEYENKCIERIINKFDNKNNRSLSMECSDNNDSMEYSDNNDSMEDITESDKQLNNSDEKLDFYSTIYLNYFSKKVTGLTILTISNTIKQYLNSNNNTNNNNTNIDNILNINKFDNDIYKLIINKLNDYKTNKTYIKEHNTLIKDIQNDKLNHESYTNTLNILEENTWELLKE